MRSRLFQAVLSYSKCSLGSAKKRCLSRIISRPKMHSIQPNEETLTERFITYLNANKDNISKSKTADVSILDSIKKDNTDSLQYLSVDDLVSIFDLLHERGAGDKWEFLKVLNVIDMEFCARLNSLKFETIFKILNAYMTVVPNRITRYKFYNTAINTLYSSMEKLSKEEIVELFFYVGLQKNTNEAKMIMRNSLNYLCHNKLPDLNTEEMCIICNATFKTSTKINNKRFLNAVKNYINNNLKVLEDTPLFLTLIKTMRHNRYQDDDLLNSILCTIFFNKTWQYYNFAAMCHILALFSDYLFYDENLLRLFYTQCLRELEDLQVKSKRTHVSDYIRVKDIKRFLWAYSNLGYAIDNDIFKTVIEPKILQKFDSGEFKNDSESLVEIVLYCWILNYQAVDLISLFNEDDIVKIRGEKSKAKHRLNLLLSCMFFENRNLYKKLNVKPVGWDGFDLRSDLSKRPVLRRIIDNLKFASAHLEVNKFEPNYQVPYLNIVGITGFKKNVYKTVNIEVLDSYICVKNKKTHPSGPMQLKLRILEKSDEALLVIREDEIDEMSDGQLQEFLVDELKFICD